ncbi:glycoside hydrolase family 130 protein [Sphingomonas abietis]|uniref:Glycosidase n=1 Tax=Sphingomonas abietis TaxID=3012344 RepID=A0ABY7NU36_9SPHN|nr:glycosidase [Sphingomonas abietis]WBO23444.1 glycosidase [Sphingomonas abietis]
MHDTQDYLIFGPDDVDLTRSPLRRSIGEPTFVLGAFNPALTRLPSGNLLLMVRVAEALSEPVRGDHVHAIRWTPDGYVLDPHPLASVDMADPRFFLVRGGGYPQMALTSLSWLLPVELAPDGRRIVAVHYERAIEPRAAYQDYGLEDPRISVIDGRYHMTVCSCSAERHGTSLYTSDDGVDWRLEGLVLDHQNKDMLLFEGRIGGQVWALTRPLGELYFAYPATSDHAGGPVIHLASSPDGLHWKPCDRPGVRARRGSSSAMKVGGGTPPILTDAGWLMLYHGVEPREKVGVYRTFWALLDRDDPATILRMEDESPLIEADPALTAPIADRLYLPTPVVFTTGIVDAGDAYIVASGEADLACRISHVPKSRFA